VQKRVATQDLLTAGVAQGVAKLDQAFPGEGYWCAAVLAIPFLTGTQLRQVVWGFALTTRAMVDNVQFHDRHPLCLSMGEG